ncbi:hypothetical protein SporoP8_07060 [Sporosarcina ureae]|uniref:hypothetical protein n=1 Tax=Sporosarcina ureae TaxID=1571 RepID=UPI000A152DE6|nr:hypothetical protein [Sporosarcina ureae]ARJ38649.1 hypothetical protein SporoP8_07060 [Sporosarcina ureae]
MMTLRLLLRTALAISVVLFISGCSASDYGFHIASTEEVENVFDQNNNAYVIITNDVEASFLKEASKALLEKKESALLFNVYMNDGVHNNADKLSHNPFRFEMPHVNAIYYLRDGQIVNEYNLENYNDTEFKFFLKNNEVK